MTPGDTVRVLTKAAAFDSRSIGDSDVAAWHEVLDNIELQDALAAVTAHYRESRDRAMPADIRKLAITIRDRRKAGQHLALPTGPTVRDRSPEVGALVHTVLDSLPKPDLHERARDRARRERGRPPAELTRKRSDKAKPPKDYPAPATDVAAALATRYLLDGYEPADVAERFAVSRRWCQRTIRRLTNGNQPTATGGRP